MTLVRIACGLTLAFAPWVLIQLVGGWSAVGYCLAAAAMSLVGLLLVSKIRDTREARKAAEEEDRRRNVNRMRAQKLMEDGRDRRTHEDGTK